MRRDLEARFKVSCDATFGGPVLRRLWADLPACPLGNTDQQHLAWPGFESEKAFGRRLDTANYIHHLDLNARQCVLGPDRIVLAGRMNLREARHAGDCLPLLLHLVGWTLRTVYGHAGLAELTSAPMPGLSFSVTEVKPRRRRAPAEER